MKTVLAFFSSVLGLEKLTQIKKQISMQEKTKNW